MFNFVDIHCHTLFRVDDGARDEKIMKSMIDIAYSDGIRTICFTPHFKIFEFESDEDIDLYRQRIDRRMAYASKYVKEAYPDMQIYLGNEVMYHSEIFSSLSRGKCNYLGNSSYALVEFNPNSSSYEIENTVLQLLRKGITPLIAHIERYSAFVKDHSLVESLKASGALMQVNARSITRFKFGKMAKFLKYVFKKKLVDVVASDAHNDTSFPPRLSKACAVITKNYGEIYAKRVFHDTPLLILMNEKI